MKLNHSCKEDSDLFLTPLFIKNNSIHVMERISKHDGNSYSRQVVKMTEYLPTPMADTPNRKANNIKHMSTTNYLESSNVA